LWLGLRNISVSIAAPVQNLRGSFNQQGLVSFLVAAICQIDVSGFIYPRFIVTFLSKKAYCQ
jgi:hypothetical protein